MIMNDEFGFRFIMVSKSESNETLSPQLSIWLSHRYIVTGPVGSIPVAFSNPQSRSADPRSLKLCTAAKVKKTFLAIISSKSVPVPFDIGKMRCRGSSVVMIRAVDALMTKRFPFSHQSTLSPFLRCSILSELRNFGGCSSGLNRRASSVISP